jgi:hypothetical protein
MAAAAVLQTTGSMQTAVQQLPKALPLGLLGNGHIWPEPAVAVCGYQPPTEAYNHTHVAGCQHHCCKQRLAICSCRCALCMHGPCVNAYHISDCVLSTVCLLSLQVRVKFEQIFMSKPMVTELLSGESQQLFPKEARLRNLT